MLRDVSDLTQSVGSTYVLYVNVSFIVLNSAIARIVLMSWSEPQQAFLVKYNHIIGTRI